MIELADHLILTDEQRAVVDLPVNSRALVTAGAGAGKTTTLVRRVDELIREQQVSAGDVLVLTFSRAAVTRIQEGMRGIEQRPRARTFDSWALDVLSEVQPEGEWPQRSFDDRIRGAALAIAAERADELFEDLRHVVMDEVQDLVGIRREMVQALLERFDCGFTVVGDLAQSVYGFQTAPELRSAETGAFVRWLREEFPGDLKELTLSDNFRARTDDARSALPLAPRLLAVSESEDAVAAKSVLSDLRRVLGRKLTLGPLDDLTFAEFCRTNPSCAVLTRTNGQALQVADALHRHRVRNALRGDLHERAAPSWMANLFATGTPTLGRDAFDRAVPAERADQAWRSLLAVSRASSGRHIDLVRLAGLLRQRRLPDDLREDEATGVIVSTIHRAKGLEFDVVVLARPEPRLADGEDHEDAEEARLLYVGLTRAREETLLLDSEWDWRFVRSEAGARWGLRGYKQWQRLGLQALPGDVHTESPAGTIGTQQAAGEIQQYLAAQVQVGDDVVLKRATVETELNPAYIVQHQGNHVGVTSEGFGQALGSWLRISNAWEVRFPANITNLRIAGVETVAGSAASGRRVGVSDLGVWLAPRLAGMGRFASDEHEEGEVA